MTVTIASSHPLCTYSGNVIISTTANAWTTWNLYKPWEECDAVCVQGVYWSCLTINAVLQLHDHVSAAIYYDKVPGTRTVATAIYFPTEITVAIPLQYYDSVGGNVLTLIGHYT